MELDKLKQRLDEHGIGYEINEDRRIVTVGNVPVDPYGFQSYRIVHRDDHRVDIYPVGQVERVDHCKGKLSTCEFVQYISETFIWRSV